MELLDPCLFYFRDSKGDLDGILGVAVDDMVYGGSKAFQAAGGGVNLVIEIGGGSTFDQSMEALTIGGHISLIGALGGIKTELNLLQIVFKKVHTHGITVGSREDHEEMNRFLEEHQIHPVIGKEVAFEQGADAIMGIAAGNHFGKIVINLDR